MLTKTKILQWFVVHVHLSFIYYESWLNITKKPCIDSRGDKEFGDGSSRSPEIFK